MEVVGDAESASPSVLALAKAASAAGDRRGALLLLHGLFEQEPQAAAAFPPALAEALIAAARTCADQEDRAARAAYERAQAARAEIWRLLGTEGLDLEDLASIRAVLDAREQAIRTEAQQRIADRPEVGAPGETRRLGLGWLERYWVERRWAPYLRARWRMGGRKRMRYIGKVQT